MKVLLIIFFPLLHKLIADSNLQLNLIIGGIIFGIIIIIIIAVVVSLKK